MIKIHVNINIFETSTWISRKLVTCRNMYSYDEVAGFLLLAFVEQLFWFQFSYVL